ncbi:MAG: hypothetical protein AMJ81_01535 [Phycisphaerae bacterium SM23_33]|jgi:hypothetical protein|nr:MAG: hypothetical protein AMJ81_01535 [Phycisphaerae bacterium SM23_33]
MARITAGRKARGAMTVEAALLFSLLLLLTFGVIEYGWAFVKTQQITNATRHAARVAVRADAINADVETAVAALMAASGISQGKYTLTLPGDVSQVLPGDTLTVRITVPYANIQLAGPAFVPMPEHLEAVVTMAKEGP